MKTAFILKNSDDPFFIWPQVWFDMHEVGALGSLLDHAPFEQHHQWQEHIVPVFDNVWPFMAICHCC
jgi:hypothetical protein